MGLLQKTLLPILERVYFQSKECAPIGRHFVPFKVHPFLENAYIPVSICIQSTLVISNSKELYETLRDIRTSTYQICGTEENN